MAENFGQSILDIALPVAATKEAQLRAALQTGNLEGAALTKVQFEVSQYTSFMTLLAGMLKSWGDLISGICAKIS